MWWVEDPFAPLVVYVAFHLTFVHLSQGVSQLQFSTNEYILDRIDICLDFENFALS